MGTKELLSKLEHNINMEAKDILAKITVHQKLVKKILSKVVDKKKTKNTTYATNFTSKMKKALKDYGKHIPSAIENNSINKDNNITLVNNSVPSTSLKLAKSKPADMSQDVYGNTMRRNNSHISLHKASLRNVSHHKGHNNYHNKTVFSLIKCSISCKIMDGINKIYHNPIFLKKFRMRLQHSRFLLPY